MFTQRARQGFLFLNDLTKNVPFLDNLKQEAIKLFNLRQQSTEGIAGLDIGPGAIKLVKINCAETPFLVESAAILSLTAGAIVKDEIKDVNAVVSSIKELVKKADLVAKDIALAIPRSLAFIKNITIDSRLTKNEIESRAWIEANRHFPDLVGDIYLDFSVIGPSADDNTQSEVLLVACRKEQIKPYIDVLRQAGLNAKIVDIDSYALERALALLVSTQNQEVVALLNLDTHLSTLIVLEKGNMVYAHDQSHDGQRLLTQTYNYLKERGMGDGVDYVGLLEDSSYNDILKESLISHLRHTMHFFYASKPNINIQRVYVSGDCGIVPGIAAFIQREINLEAEVANPFAKLRLGPGFNTEKINQHAPAFMLSCGLALSKTVY